jgi:hypothetical protein
LLLLNFLLSFLEIAVVDFKGTDLPALLFDIFTNLTRHVKLWRTYLIGGGLLGGSALRDNEACHDIISTLILLSLDSGHALGFLELFVALAPVVLLLVVVRIILVTVVLPLALWFLLLLATLGALVLLLLSGSSGLGCAALDTDFLIVITAIFIVHICPVGSTLLRVCLSHIIYRVWFINYNSRN